MDDDALAYLAIVRLQHAYGDIATRQAWPEFAALMISDAHFSFDLRSGKPIEITGAAALGKMGAASIERFSFYQYVPLNAVVTVGEDGAARGRAYALELSEDRESGRWLEVYGLYHDDYALLDGALRFSRRRYQTLARRSGGRLEAFALEDRRSSRDGSPGSGS